MGHGRDCALPQQSAHLLAAHRVAVLAGEHHQTRTAIQLPSASKRSNARPHRRHLVRAQGHDLAGGNRPDTLLPVNLAPYSPAGSRRLAPPSARGNRRPARPPCPPTPCGTLDSRPHGSAFGWPTPAFRAWASEPRPSSCLQRRITCRRFRPARPFLAVATPRYIRSIFGYPKPTDRVFREPSPLVSGHGRLGH